MGLTLTALPYKAYWDLLIPYDFLLNSLYKLIEYYKHTLLDQ